jgi:predicted SnoaL-like aldol condensation-catalyzing enzyme
MSMTSERNKQAVTRLYEAFRAGDTGASDALIVNDYIQHNPQAGNAVATVKAFFAQSGPLD